MYGNSRDDLETGFVSTPGGRNPSSTYGEAGSWKDALFGTTQRKVVTGLSGLLIFILLLTTIVFASRDSTTEHAIPTPTPADGNPCPTGCKSGILPTNYTGAFVQYNGNPSTSPDTMPVNFTIGFTADTYITEDTMRVYQVLRNEGAEFIAISGDLDYIDYPEGWDGLITKTLGDDYPMLVASGNHDYAIWPQYQQKLITRWQKAGITTCTGVVGVMHTCTWKGLTIVQIAPGVFNESRGLYRNVSGIGDIDFVQYIRDAFAKYPSPWKICSWHKNQHLMQTGDKSNETGWGVYNECLLQGAMVMTGHEHSYERSYQMSSFEHQVFDPSNPRNLTLTPEKGIVVVQGLGGREVRVNKQPQQNWWAALDNYNTSARFSGVVCKYNLNGNAKLAYCYDKNIDRVTKDEWYITLP